MIEVIDVGKRYGEQQVLSGVNLTVETGTIVGLAGRNGSGKSVLLRIISGLLRPDTGEVRYDGHKLPDGTFYPSIGVVLDQVGFVPMYTGYRNLMTLAKVKKKIGKDEIHAVMDLVGLGDAKNKFYFQYSKGMKKRLALAQALMEDPEVLILDEPFDGIDYKGLLYFRDIFMEEKKKGKTILLTSHNAEDLDVLSDIKYHLADGHLSPME